MIVSCDFRHGVSISAIVVVEDQAPYELLIVVTKLKRRSSFTPPWRRDLVATQHG